MNGTFRHEAKQNNTNTKNSWFNYIVDITFQLDQIVNNAAWKR